MVRMWGVKWYVIRGGELCGRVGLGVGVVVVVVVLGECRVVLFTETDRNQQELTKKDQKKHVK